MKPIPNTVESLIGELEALYPPRCVEVGDTLEAAHRYAGAHELVASLRRRLDWTREHARPTEILNVRSKG